MVSSCRRISNGAVALEPYLVVARDHGVSLQRRGRPPVSSSPLLQGREGGTLINARVLTAPMIAPAIESDLDSAADLDESG